VQLTQSVSLYFTSLRSKDWAVRFFSDTLWAMLGNGLAKGLAMIAGIVVARLLGSDVFGEYAIVRNTVLALSGLSTFGLGFAVTKFVAENLKNDSGMVNTIVSCTVKLVLSLSFLLSIVIFFIAEPVAVNFMESDSLALPLKVVSILVMLLALTNLQVGIIAGLGEFRVMARVNLYSGLFTMVLTATLTYFFKFYGALIALLLTQLFSLVLYQRVISHKVKISIFGKWDLPVLRNIISYSIPLSIQEIVFAFSMWGMSVVIIKFTTYSELGLYTAAMQWNALILFIPWVLGNVVLTHFSANSNDLYRHSRLLKVTLFVGFISVLVPLIVIFLLRNWIEGLYGDNFLGLSGLLAIAVGSSLFISLSNIYTQAYMSKSKNWTMLVFKIIRDFGMIIIVYFLLSRDFELDGAQLVLLTHLSISFVFFLLMAVWYHFKISPVNS
jgi:O-antigen/teichoic acid export membrane protein